MNPDHDDQKKFWKIIILKGVYPILKFEDVQYDFSALRTQTLKCPRTQTSSEGTILDNKNDDPKVF